MAVPLRHGEPVREKLAPAAVELILKRSGSAVRSVLDRRGGRLRDAVL